MLRERAGDDLVELWDQQHSAAGSPLFSQSGDELGQLGQLEHAPVQLSTLGALCGMLSDIFAVATGAAHVPRGASWGLLLAALAAILDQANGSTSILEYAQRMLEDAGEVAPEMQDALAVAVAAAKVVGVVAGLLVVNTVGRRPLLACGSTLSALAIVMMSAGVTSKSILTITLGMCTFVFVFCATWGIGYWVVVTEVTASGGPRYAVASQTAATMILFAAGWATGLSFLSVAKLGPSALLLYAGISALGGVYAALLLPELRGCTLEECAARIEARVGCWRVAKLRG